MVAVHGCCTAAWWVACWLQLLLLFLLRSCYLKPIFCVGEAPAYQPAELLGQDS